MERALFGNKYLNTKCILFLRKKTTHYRALGAFFEVHSATVRDVSESHTTYGCNSVIVLFLNMVQPMAAIRSLFFSMLKEEPVSLFSQQFVRCFFP